MLRDAADQSKPELALAMLRKRICLADPTAPLPLHEGALAEEFGMSRTPIRQVLQRLAYERLVEIRSGVGTVAPPMDPAHRARDLRTHQGILRAILVHPPTELSLSQHADVVALGALFADAAEVDPPLHFEGRSRLLAGLSGVIADPILKDAFLAAHWRVIRWHMRDAATAPEKALAAMQTLVARVTAYQPRNARSLVEQVLEGDLAP